MREFLLKIARKAIEDLEYIPKKIPKKAQEKKGVFVTITENGELRGCIGFVYPIYPLWKGVILAAREAAYNDPRFPPLRKEEINKIKIEISILTEPQKIEGDPSNFPNKIKIGKDGLIVKYDGYSGLLLPQVATEFGFNSKEFLDETCVKAGLPPGCWKYSEVYKFQAEIISED